MALGMSGKPSWTTPSARIDSAHSSTFDMNSTGARYVHVSPLVSAARSRSLFSTSPLSSVTRRMPLRTAISAIGSPLSSGEWSVPSNPVRCAAAMPPHATSTLRAFYRPP